MPTVVGISTFISRTNFMLHSVEHEKSLMTSRPGFVHAMTLGIAYSDLKMVQLLFRNVKTLFFLFIPPIC